jgi:DnaJ-class molecular chaperone
MNTQRIDDAVAITLARYHRDLKASTSCSGTGLASRFKPYDECPTCGGDGRKS